MQSLKNNDLANRSLSLGMARDVGVTVRARRGRGEDSHIKERRMPFGNFN